MKKLFWLLLFLFPVYAQCEPIYPWHLNAFVGGASLCDDLGCFGPRGIALGGSFGRPMGNTWSFELEGAYAKTKELQAPRFDELTGTLFTPELHRTRVWGGGTFLAKIKRFDSGDIHIALGFAGGYEQKKEVTPPGIFHVPTTNNGIKGGISAGAGWNYWFSDNWAIRPEIRFYGIFGGLSGLRYTAGIVKKF